jgi:hypothetical protein
MFSGAAASIRALSVSSRGSRVREALRVYHDGGQGASGQPITWVDLWEDITHTATNNNPEPAMTPTAGAERLRQFVEGVKKEGATLKICAYHDSGESCKGQ